MTARGALDHVEDAALGDHLVLAIRLDGHDAARDAAQDVGPRGDVEDDLGLVRRLGQHAADVVDRVVEDGVHVADEDDLLVVRALDARALRLEAVDVLGRARAAGADDDERIAALERAGEDRGHRETRATRDVAGRHARYPFKPTTFPTQ